MRFKLIVFGFILSVVFFIVILCYSIIQTNQIIELHEKGEKHFKSIVAAATEVCSYVKRAEGHLMMYLVLHRKKDKQKFIQRMESLNEQVAILNQRVMNADAKTILQRIMISMKGIIPAGNALIAYHDESMQSLGKFEIETQQETLVNLHDKFSSVRRLGVELASLELELEDNLKTERHNEFHKLHLYVLLLVLFTFILTVFLGYSLNSFIKATKKEISARKQSEEQLQIERDALRDAADKIKVLRGLIPICARCKKIRDDKGYWNQVESYIGENSEAEFTHSICPECKDKLYPDL